MSDLEFMNIAILAECAFHPAYAGSEETREMGFKVLRGLAKEGSDMQRKYVEALEPFMCGNNVAVSY